VVLWVIHFLLFLCFFRVQGKQTTKKTNNKKRKRKLLK
jgi:hypothetical protein